MWKFSAWLATSVDNETDKFDYRILLHLYIGICSLAVDDVDDDDDDSQSLAQ